MNYIRLKSAAAVLMIGVFMSGCAGDKIEPRFSASFYHDGTFESQMDDMNQSFGEMMSIIWEVFMEQTTEEYIPAEGQIPVRKLSAEDLSAMEENSVVRFGHSTLLFRLDGRFVLTDPVFSKSISPIPFVGPQRFHMMPIALEELPFIDIVIISHNHYDHLDEPTIRTLKGRIGHIYTTLGIKAELVAFGVDAAKITELDWWEEATDGTISIMATPAQHFSGRGLFDRNKTLWASWVIHASAANLYFGADSGYFDGFKEIGERYGPFDMTFLEAGAYNERWKSIHMMPEESVQAHIDLKGKLLFPVHNGTFKLAMHPWREPFERVLTAASEKEVRVVHPEMGEVIPLLKESKSERWWR